MEQNVKPLFDVDTMNMKRSSIELNLDTHTSEQSYENAGLIGQWAAEVNENILDIPRDMRGE